MKEEQELFEEAKFFIEKGRLSVLEDFDTLCKADALMGFTDDEFKTIKKFFEFNKQVSGWDKSNKEQ